MSAFQLKEKRVSCIGYTDALYWTLDRKQHLRFEGVVESAPVNMHSNITHEMKTNIEYIYIFIVHIYTHQHIPI